jgi:hypothetical protein
MTPDLQMEASAVGFLEGVDRMISSDSPQVPVLAKQTVTNLPEDQPAAEFDDSGFDLDESLYDFEAEPDQM